MGFITGFVNDSGKIKGFVVKLDDSPCQALTIDVGDSLEFPGFNFLFPQGITNSGIIVVQVGLASAHGFIATPQ